ncbi:MAG: hypothetical protein WCJ84_02510 [Candidatus Peregrinibacteria bacterium]
MNKFNKLLTAAALAMSLTTTGCDSQKSADLKPIDPDICAIQADKMKELKELNNEFEKQQGPLQKEAQLLRDNINQTAAFAYNQPPEQQTTLSIAFTEMRTALTAQEAKINAAYSNYPKKRSEIQEKYKHFAYEIWYETGDCPKN